MAIVPVSYVVAVWLPRDVPGLVVPKYTLCDVAPEPAVQLKSAVVLTLVAPFAGFGVAACPGGPPDEAVTVVLPTLGVL